RVPSARGKNLSFHRAIFQAAPEVPGSTKPTKNRVEQPKPLCAHNPDGAVPTEGTDAVDLDILRIRDAECRGTGSSNHEVLHANVFGAFDGKGRARFVARDHEREFARIGFAAVVVVAKTFDVGVS